MRTKMRERNKAGGDRVQRVIKGHSFGSSLKPFTIPS